MRYAVCIIMSIFVAGADPDAVTGGFKERGQLMAHPFAIPNPVHFGNYRDILQMGTFWRQLSNSLLVTASTTVLVLGVGEFGSVRLCAHAVSGARLDCELLYFRPALPDDGRHPAPLHPMRRLGLVDSLWGIILPQVAFGLPATILILRGFFASIPKEIEEPAAIDGCIAFGFFWRILLPLADRRCPPSWC